MSAFRLGFAIGSGLRCVGAGRAGWVTRSGGLFGILLPAFFVLLGFFSKISLAFFELVVWFGQGGLPLITAKAEWNDGTAMIAGPSSTRI